MTSLIQGSHEYIAVKQEILDLHGVTPTEQFNVKTAIEQRVEYLKNFIKHSGLKGFVLGISGGVDSSTTGKLCQMACEQLRSEGYDAKFIAMRLPAGVQLDESDAQKALEFIKPDVSLTVNIGQAANVLNGENIQAVESVGVNLSDSSADFHKGNMKARLRMVAQYHTAAVYGCAVIGTDHNCENVMGFYTKFGDGACDLTVLNGLSKRQVRMMAKELGAPQSVYGKIPTADLEELKPQKTDDEGFGFPYEKIEDFLEGKEIDPETEFKIIRQYVITRHKRDPILGFVAPEEKPTNKMKVG